MISTPKSQPSDDVPFGPEDTPWQKAFSRLSVLDEIPRVSPPEGDPREVYPNVPEVPYGKVQLPPCGLDPEQYAEAEALFHRYLDRQAGRAIGYQLTSNLDYSGRLAPYLDQHLNNVGDPYQSGAYTPNSKVLERAVLDYYASLWNAKWPHRDDDPDSYWGYLLTMGARATCTACGTPATATRAGCCCASSAPGGAPTRRSSTPGRSGTKARARTPTTRWRSSPRTRTTR